MNKINVKDLYNRKLKNCYLSCVITTKKVYIRNEDGYKEEKTLYTILGTDITGKRQIIEILFEKPYDNRFWLEFFEKIKARGVEFILFLVIPKNKNIERGAKLIYNKINIVISPEETIEDITRFFTEKTSRKFIKSLKDVFYAQDIKESEVKSEMFKEELKNNKIVLILLDKNKEKIKDFYKYPYEIRKFLYPYYTIRELKREINKINNLENLLQNIMEVNEFLLNYVNTYEKGMSYYKADWLDLLNLIYERYEKELEEYII